MVRSREKCIILRLLPDSVVRLLVLKSLINWRACSLVGNTTFNGRGLSESAFTRPSLNSLGLGCKDSEKDRINSLIQLISLEILAAGSNLVDSGRPWTAMLDKHFSQSDSSWSRLDTWLTLLLGLTLIGLDSIVVTFLSREVGSTRSVAFSDHTSPNFEVIESTQTFNSSNLELKETRKLLHCAKVSF